MYTYDNAGNRISQDETYTSEQVMPAVDGTGISEIKYMVKRSEYVYGNTNRLLKLVEKMKAADGTELLQKITAFRYDNNGNELRRSVEYISLYNRANPKAYEAAVYSGNTTEPIHAVVDQTVSCYDGFNRLVKTELIKAKVKTAAEYKYNGDGLRVQKTVRRSDKGNTAETTSYLYDRQHVILETRGNENIRYVRGVNYIGRIESTGKLSYYMYNGHGDVVQTVSEAGEIENQYDYDIFGNPILTVENYANSIRYAGEFYDRETGLYYLRARYYDPYIGRFISEDSYWGEDTNPLSLNLYTYCHNDPIQFIDPSGHSAYEKGQQQVEEQCKNESKQGLKNKLNAQKSEYERALKNGDKDLADLYKGRIDAISDMMSGSGGKSGKGSSKSGSSKNRDSNKVTVTWEGYIIDIDISEYNDYKSHGWGVFYGKAYADKMYNSSDQLHSITTSSGKKVSIENSGYIGSIITGEGSQTFIGNKGVIGTIVTGVGSTTTINNNGDIKIINTGDSHSGKRGSNTTIVNSKKIGEINTGKESENVVFNTKYGDITSLVTGEGNRTAIYADEFEYVKAELQKGSYEKIKLNSPWTDNFQGDGSKLEKALQPTIDIGIIENLAELTASQNMYLLYQRKPEFYLRSFGYTYDEKVERWNRISDSYNIAMDLIDKYLTIKSYGGVKSGSITELDENILDALNYLQDKSFDENIDINESLPLLDAVVKSLEIMAEDNRSKLGDYQYLVWDERTRENFINVITKQQEEIAKTNFNIFDEKVDNDIFCSRLLMELQNIKDINKNYQQSETNMLDQANSIK